MQYIKTDAHQIYLAYSQVGENLDSQGVEGQIKMIVIYENGCSIIKRLSYTWYTRISLNHINNCCSKLKRLQCIKMAVIYNTRVILYKKDCIISKMVVLYQNG